MIQSLAVSYRENMLSQNLKAKLKKGEKLLGIIMMFDFWPGYVELVRKYGFDFLVVDMEHGQIGFSEAVELCRIGRLLDLPVLIRPGICEFDRIRRSLEIGSGGLMLPWVETKEQLDTIHDAAFSPPRGRHGMGGPAILTVDGIGTREWKSIEDNTFIMCQVETPGGVDFTPEIASREWVDAVMLGPYDLAMNMGLTDQYLKAPEHIAAIGKVRDLAHKQGKPAGMVAGTGTDARGWFEKGFDIILLGEMIGHFRRGLQESLDELRG